MSANTRITSDADISIFTMSQKHSEDLFYKKKKRSSGAKGEGFMAYREVSQKGSNARSTTRVRREKKKQGGEVTADVLDDDSLRDAPTKNIAYHLRQINFLDVFNLGTLGLMLTLSWYFITFFSPIVHYSHNNDITLFNSVFGFSHLGLALTLCAGAVVPTRIHNYINSRKTLKFLVTLLLFVCTFTLVLVEHKYFTQPWCSIASYFAGTLLGLLNLMFGLKVCSMGMVKGVVSIFSAFFMAGLLFAVAVAMPKVVAIVIAVILPLLIGFVLIKLDIPRVEGEPVTIQFALLHGGFNIRLILVVGMLSLAQGLSRTILMNYNPIVLDGAYAWMSFVAIIIATVLLGIPLFSTRILNFAGSYRVTAATLGFIYLLMPIVTHGSLFSDLASLVSYSALTMILWIMTVRIVGRYSLPAQFVLGLGLGVYYGGMLIGEFSGALYASFFVLTQKALSVFTLICVCLVFFGYLFLFNEQAMDKLLNERGKQGPKRFAQRCDEVSKAYGLSPREEEIMMLVVKGRSNPRIQETLGLTAGTVNSHLSHLYRKLNVHDKQSLIDLVENFNQEQMSGNSAE